MRWWLWVANLPQSSHGTEDRIPVHQRESESKPELCHINEHHSTTHQLKRSQHGHPLRMRWWFWVANLPQPLPQGTEQRILVHACESESKLELRHIIVNEHQSTKPASTETQHRHPLRMARQIQKWDIVTNLNVETRILTLFGYRIGRGRAASGISKDNQSVLDSRKLLMHVFRFIFAELTCKFLSRLNTDTDWISVMH
ncbi:hypothetical protein BaRGS_00033090 [Batillaria attramentaria]|uniref:Uncharacterized protein n=1 Tax=Batillaria attramentaria TaxID=370345 RepID=A0ABD0JLC9_9CAEN